MSINPLSPVLPRDRWGRHPVAVLIIILVFVAAMTALDTDPLLAAAVALGVMAAISGELPPAAVLRPLPFRRAWPSALGGGSAA